jgi:DNA (cytosine-5)-methyltransferase 1
MRFLVDSLEALGFRWAYRVVDARAFGLPQRRQRVLLLASRSDDPRSILFQGSETPPPPSDPDEVACGFYWTEGLKGLGWAIDAVPTVKGGSTIGIPSPPAIRMPVGREIVTPDIRDAERLQGFPADWTEPALERVARAGVRWRLIGNAVSVPVAEWVGRCLRTPSEYDDRRDEVINSATPWPRAAWGQKGTAYKADLSTWPVRCPYQHLAEFLRYPTKLLSQKATSGFFNRMTASTTLRFPEGFRRDVMVHLMSMQGELALA